MEFEYSNLSCRPIVTDYGDPILGSQLVLSHDWILEPFKKTTTVLTKWILFRGEKIFRVSLKDTRISKNPSESTKDPILIFLVNNLNKLGLRVQEVRYTNQVLGLEYNLMKERRVNKAEDTAGESLQLFTDDLTEMPIEKCTFTFSIWIAGSVPSYCFHISDRLTKEQFWSASLESQHHVDVQFVVKDKTFSAHKAVLAARSPIFAAEFTKEKPGQKDDHGDGLQQIIRIDDVDPASVEQFLYFLYTGEPVKSSLTNEQLLNLADRYQVITLVNLCRAAMKNIDAQQIMSSLCKINSYAADLHKQASVLDSIHMRQDKETEIFHETKTSVFHFPWKFDGIFHAMSPGFLHYPKSIFEYQNEKLFAPHFSGTFVSRNCLENPWIHLICANHRNFGFKVAKAFCSMGYRDASWMEMKPRRADNVELFLFVVQGRYPITTHSYDPGYLYFRTEMTSTIGNYHYEMMDTSWTTQLWQAALDQQLTDVEIFVGPVKLEAHRVILSARSPVLAALLKNNDQVKSSIVIEENMDIDVVKHFLKFLYTGCLEISATSKQLRELAKMYEMETLMEICQLANCSPDATSKLYAKNIDFHDKPSAFPFQLNLKVVNHFLSFRHNGNWENLTYSRNGFWDSSANIKQMTALAEMYDVGPFNKICQLDRSVPLDLDEITTFLLTAL